MLVGARDFVALVMQHRGHRAHRGPADAHEMKRLRCGGNRGGSRGHKNREIVVNSPLGHAESTIGRT